MAGYEGTVDHAGDGKERVSDDCSFPVGMIRTELLVLTRVEGLVLVVLHIVGSDGAERDLGDL